MSSHYCEAGGIQVCCLLDSGSQVSSITESFFNRHFLPRGSNLLDTNKWLTLTTANGLEIPYIGHLEVDCEAQGVTILQRDIVVARDPPDLQSGLRKEAVPGLIGINTIQEITQETSTLQAVAKAMTLVQGGEDVEVDENLSDWLATHQARLRDAHQRAG